MIERLKGTDRKCVREMGGRGRDRDRETEREKERRMIARYRIIERGEKKQKENE